MRGDDGAVRVRCMTFYIPLCMKPNQMTGANNKQPFTFSSFNFTFIFIRTGVRAPKQAGIRGMSGIAITRWHRYFTRGSFSQIIMTLLSIMHDTYKVKFILSTSAHIMTPQPIHLYNTRTINSPAPTEPIMPGPTSKRGLVPTNRRMEPGWSSPRSAQDGVQSLIAARSFRLCIALYRRHAWQL